MMQPRQKVWQVRRFLWHVRDGTLRRFDLSWGQIWRLCGSRAKDKYPEGR